MQSQSDATPIPEQVVTMDKVKFDYSNVGSASALSSAQRLHKGRKIPIKSIENFLKSKDSYTLHRQVRKNFTRNYYKVEKIGQLFEIDLMDLSNLKKFNNNVRYLLMAIDVFSKQLFSIPLKAKSGKTVTEAMEIIIKQFKYPIEMIQSDAGKEFVGGKFQEMLKKHGIRYRVVTNPDNKAAVVERSIRTFRILLSKFMTENNTRSYIKSLDKLLSTYNSRIHSTIKRAPRDVTPKNQADVLKIYQKSWRILKKRKPRYSIDTLVRVKKSKNKFSKEMDTTFTRELFKIKYINKSLPLPMYTLRDLKNNLIKGHFYESELQPVNIDLQSDLFKIEKNFEKT